MDGDRRRAAGATDAENPMDKILEQMQGENFSHAPGEEMTHVAGVSFVDDVGLSLGGMFMFVDTCICTTYIHPAGF